MALRMASSQLKSGPIPTEELCQLMLPGPPWDTLSWQPGEHGAWGARKVGVGDRSSQTGRLRKSWGSAGAGAWPTGDPLAQL